MKPLAITCLVVMLALLAGFVMLLAFLHRVDRRVAIIAGEQILSNAYNDYTSSGVLASGGGSYQVWLSSNTATIGGTQHHCFLELRSDRFREDGTLTMNSNRTFIWIARGGAAKFIPPGYKPPLFGY
jgi:hypothetical protein